MIRRGFQLVATLFLLQGVRAQVDQENWPLVSTNSASFNSFYGLRQEFRPTRTSLDTVELSIAPCAFDPIYPEAAAAILSIRQGGVAGPVIANSLPLSISPGFRGSIVFQFATPLSLTPDALYALHPFSEAPAGWCFDANAPFGSLPGYTRGRLFFGGSVVEGDCDLIFREGISIPEPAVSLLLAMGVILLAQRRFLATRFRALSGEFESDSLVGPIRWLGK